MFEEMDTTDSTHLHPNSSKRGRHDHPSLLFQGKLLTMLSEEQIPETTEETIEEMDLTDSTDLKLNVSQSKEDKQKEDIPCIIIEEHVFIILKSPLESPFMFTLVLAPLEFKENADISDTMDLTSPYFRNWAKEQTEHLGFFALLTKDDKILIKVEPLYQKNSNNIKSAHSPRKRPFENEENLTDHSPKKRKVQCPVSTSLDLQDLFKSQTKVPIKQRYDQVHECLKNMNSINPPFPSFQSTLSVLEKYKFEHYFESFKEMKNQFAFSVVLMADGLREFLPEVEPQHRENNPAGSPNERTLHSEEILSSQLDTFINQNKFRVCSLLIYTYNSPCLKWRGKHRPCMFLLHDKARQWHHDYGITTEVCFTRFWGLNGHSLFKDLEYSWLSNPAKTVSRYKTTKLSLDSDSLTKYLKRSKENVKPELQKLITEAEGKCCSIEDHIKHGQKHIDAFDIHHQQKTGLKVSWEKMVCNSLMPQIRQKVNADFNTDVVTLFQMDLELLFQGNSPMKLYHIPMNTLQGL